MATITTVMLIKLFSYVTMLVSMHILYNNGGTEDFWKHAFNDVYVHSR